MPRFCDVSLPVPLDQAFTYELPETLRHRTQTGCRVLVPFGPRKLTGTVLEVHDRPPDVAVRPVLRLLDEQPALDGAMLQLGRWIAGYYCCPLGEVLRTMTPLGGELRRGKVYSLTGRGQDAARQLSIGTGGEDPGVAILQLLLARPLSLAYLKRKVPSAARVLRLMEQKGFVTAEDVEAARDPWRAAAERLRVEFLRRDTAVKLNKGERELLAFLELHPGSHNVAALIPLLAHAGAASRSLARKQLVALRTEQPVPAGFAPRPPHELNRSQQAAFESVRAALEAGRFQVFLVHGVTGSGKTEVYLRAIEAVLMRGRSALMLVPEIGLTPAVAGQFYHRFGHSVAILHSAFQDAERAEQWRRIRNGEARVVVGTRSGVFAPVRDLGLIVVDEEHDQSYKQEETPRYNGRDVAVVRARQTGAVVVLGSATPSLESRYNVERGKYTLLEMPERIEQRPMPEVRLIDMRQEFLETRKQSLFARGLVDEVRARLQSGEQTMLLLNRRGFSNAVACRACGERLQCAHCAVALTFHKRDRRMLCHYCGYAEKVPSVCPKCQSEYLYFLGSGSEKVEEELHREFAGARIARMDRDTVTGKRQYETVLHDFREGRFDILVGTQMIAKGHDIPNVTLVGIVSADVGLNLPDFRAAERTFQLLTQAAGRAGRGAVPGRVLIQTLNPDHYAIRFAALQDYRLFYQKEIQFRRLMRYPPFAALANVVLRSPHQEAAMEMSAEIARLLTPPREPMKLLGPAEAPVPRLKNEYRYQLLIKTASRPRLNETLRALRQHALERKWPASAMVIDVDPLTLL